MTGQESGAARAVLVERLAEAVTWRIEPDAEDEWERKRVSNWPEDEQKASRDARVPAPVVGPVFAARGQGVCPCGGRIVPGDRVAVRLSDGVLAHVESGRCRS